MYILPLITHAIPMKKKNFSHSTNNPRKSRFLQIMFHCIFLFFLASFLGFLWEVVIFLIKEDTFYNRGFLYGPWLPIYGVGAVLFFLLLRKIEHRPLLVFLLSGLIGSVLEYTIGWFLDHFFHLRYWDYSDYFCNWNGYICFWSVVGFCVAGVLWVCIISHFALYFYEKMPAPWQRHLLSLLILTFLMDCAASLIVPNQGNGITFR